MTQHEPKDASIARVMAAYGPAFDALAAYDDGDRDVRATIEALLASEPDSANKDLLLDALDTLLPKPRH